MTANGAALYQSWQQRSFDRFLESCYSWSMSHIELDEQTARAITEAAKAQGISVADFLRGKVLGDTSSNGSHEEGIDFDKELDALTFSGPTLPSDLSRADIYTDE